MSTPTIEKFLKQNEEKELLRFSTAGSVDDGKSTLIGRLLHDSKNVYEDHLQSVTTKDSEQRIDFALLTDGLRAEREQGITIDVAYRYFSTPKRKFIIADTPGHEQYTRNMATGCSTANLTIILIDARNGVLTQSKRHAFIATLLGIPHVVVAVNKMDLVDYSQERFEEIKASFSGFAARLNVSDMRFVPISALNGDNVVDRSKNMPWYKGESILELLEDIHIASDRNMIDFRFPVQCVIRPNQDFRGYAGQVASGIVRKGDEVMVLPSRKISRVKSIVTFDGELEEAFPPLSLTITLEDEIDISRGDMLVRPTNIPHVERRVEAMVVWMSEKPMDLDTLYIAKHTTSSTKMRIDEVLYRVDVNTLNRVEDCDRLNLNEIGRLSFTANKPLFFDSYRRNRSTGSFILVDPITNNTVAAGMIINRVPSDQMAQKMDHTHQYDFKQQSSKVSLGERVTRFSQKPLTVWITGLVSSGKSGVAYGLERKLFDLNHAVTVLDGENVRRGLNRDLSFEPTDVTEHMRRVAEATKILNDAGMIVICAFVSPSASLRRQVRDIVGPDRFLEVHLDAPLDWCKKRDDSGLYAKAEKGELRYLAGVNIPYETSDETDLVLPVNEIGQDEAIARVLELVRKFQR